MTAVAVHAPLPGNVVPITPSSFLAALDAFADWNGDRGTLITWILWTNGVSARELSYLDDPLYQADYNVFPETALFHLLDMARYLAVHVDDLDKMGWAWPDIATDTHELWEGINHHV